MVSDSTYSSFFYGTLMHPKILKRVIRNDASHLQIAPAVLFEHTRHKVKYADYPGLVSYIQGQSLIGRELTQDERCVRGSLVTGLTATDMKFLNYFEGPAYIKRNVSVYRLQPLVDIAGYAIDEASLVSANPSPIPSQSEFLPPVSAQAYIYDTVDDLAADLWSFKDFVKKNAWKWY